MNYNETWARLHAEAKGRLNELLAEARKGDDAGLLEVLRAVFGKLATVSDYTTFYAQWRAAKEAGERMAELVVVYGCDVLKLPSDAQEALRLAIPYARGCLAAVAAESACATSGRDVPSLQTFRALAARDDTTATRLYHEHIAQVASRR